MLSEIILERTVNEVVIQCGFNKVDKRLKAAVLVGKDVTYFENILKARSAFWKHVK